MRLVEQEEGARLARPAAQMIMEAGLRLYDTKVREHRLCYHARHVARFERLSESIWVVEGDQAEVALPGAVDSVVLRTDLSLFPLEEPLLFVTMVVTFEHDDHTTPGGEAGQPDRLDVGRGGREGELPARQPEPSSHLLCHPKGVLNRQHELHPARRPRGDRLRHRGRGVATEGAHVGHVSVQVAVAIDVHDVGSLAVGDVERILVVDTHEPAHRHTIWHALEALTPQLYGAGPLAPEASLLSVAKFCQALRHQAIDRRSHRTSQAAAWAPEPPAATRIGAKVSVPKITSPSTLASRS